MKRVSGSPDFIFKINSYILVWSTYVMIWALVEPGGEEGPVPLALVVELRWVLDWVK